MNAMVAIGAKSDQLRDKLGIVFDPSMPLDFVDLMRQLHDRFGDASLSITDMNDVIQVFGRRGARAVMDVIGRWEEWEKEVTRADQDFTGFAARMKKAAEDSLPAAFKKLGNSIAVQFARGAKPMADFMKNNA